MSDLLKFESVAELGDVIKAYDFEPFPGRSERYVVGKVVEKGMFPFDPERGWGGFAGYKIEVSKDTAFPKMGRDIVYVPFEMDICDFDNRVSKVN